MSIKTQKIIRFIPPLVITKEHVDEMVSILESCLQQAKLNANGVFNTIALEWKEKCK